MTASSASASGVARASLQTAWDIAQPITPVGYYPRFGPIPATVAVHDQTGDWRSPGQTRRLELADGGSVVETTAVVVPLAFFSYDLSEFRGAFGPLVAGAHAEWRFSAVDGGTRIEWTYVFHAKPGRAFIVVPIVRLFWAPYMRRVLPGIIDAVERGSA